MRLVTVLAILFALGNVFAQSTSSPKPLTQGNILQLLKSDVPSARIAELVGTHGIDFEPSADFVVTLRQAGANDDLINALRIAK
jgi:hypothetical protein